MNNDDIINEAIRRFHQLKQDMRPIQTGDIIAHVSDKVAYEARSIDGDTVTGFYLDGDGMEHTATFGNPV